MADLSIVEGDALEDIWMTQNVKMVVLDGKVIDIGFNGYKNPIASFYSYQSLPLDLEIMFLIEGSGPTTLKVRGQGGMWSFHRIMLNGQALPTSFVSKDEINAIIAEERIDMIVMLMMVDLKTSLHRWAATANTDRACAKKCVRGNPRRRAAVPKRPSCPLVFHHLALSISPKRPTIRRSLRRRSRSGVGVGVIGITYIVKSLLLHA